jgi:hypothetical protein
MPSALRNVPTCRNNGTRSSKVVDIIVERDDVERFVGCSVADVADFYPYPVLQAPLPNVLPCRLGDFRL